MNHHQTDALDRHARARARLAILVARENRRAHPLPPVPADARRASRWRLGAFCAALGFVIGFIARGVA